MSCRYCGLLPAPGYKNCARHVLYQRRYQRERKGLGARSDDAALEALINGDVRPTRAFYEHRVTSVSEAALAREVLHACPRCRVTGPHRLLADHLRVDHGVSA